jgi:hypothetical protein
MIKRFLSFELWVCGRHVTRRSLNQMQIEGYNYVLTSYDNVMTSMLAENDIRISSKTLTQKCLNFVIIVISV